MVQFLLLAFSDGAVSAFSDQFLEVVLWLWQLQIHDFGLLQDFCLLQAQWSFIELGILDLLWFTLPLLEGG
ncbi:hypothetical protein Dimus_034924 [Dionaea muscipula]